MGPRPGRRNPVTVCRAAPGGRLVKGGLRFSRAAPRGEAPRADLPARAWGDDPGDALMKRLVGARPPWGVPKVRP